MKIKSEKNFWAGLLFVVCGLVFAVGALDYRFGSSAQPGPGYFPFGLGIVLALLGAFVLFGSLTIETEGGDRVGRWALRPLLWINLSVALFGWILPHAGLFVALPLLVILAALAGDEFRWRDALLAAVVLTAGCWAIFVRGLGLVIPLWPAFVG